MFLSVLSAGIGILGQMDDYAIAKAKAKVAKKQQEWHNKMVNIADANNQNAITTNTILAMQQSAAASEQIQRQARASVGQVETAAGATGTIGASVRAAKLAVQAAEGQAQYTREQALQSTFLAADQQRRNSTLQANMQQDYSAIQQPSIGKALLGMAGTVLGASSSIGGSSQATAEPKSFTNSGYFIGIDTSAPIEGSQYFSQTSLYGSARPFTF